MKCLSIPRTEDKSGNDKYPAALPSREHLIPYLCTAFYRHKKIGSRRTLGKMVRSKSSSTACFSGTEEDFGLASGKPKHCPTGAHTIYENSPGPTEFLRRRLRGQPPKDARCRRHCQRAEG